MFYSGAVGNFAQKQKIILNNWKLLKNTFKVTDPVSPSIIHPSQINLLKSLPAGSHPGKNPSFSCRNFSTGTVARSNNQGPAQNKEKMKNYVMAGIVVLFTSIVIINNSLRTSYDDVFIKNSSK